MALDKPSPESSDTDIDQSPEAREQAPPPRGPARPKTDAPRRFRPFIWPILFWLLLWEALSRLIHENLLLVGPWAVLVRLRRLLGVPDFWRAVGFSFARIIAGFLLGLICGVLLAVLASNRGWLRKLLAPLVLTVKTIPVASFVILILIWLPSRELSICIAFLIVFPIFYTNTLDGLSAQDRRLAEMAVLFRVPARRRLRYIALPQVLPFFRAGARLALGLCWKAGVAAELIGLPRGSIGEQLYNAKIYLDTASLFAWTLIIILLALACEKICLKLLDCLTLRLERGR